MPRALLLVSTLTTFWAVAAAAQTSIQSLSTAPSIIRPLATDRPDRTESPYTVPKGWLQIESDLVSRGHLESGDETIDATNVMSFNMKYGVTPRLDLQFVFSPWVRVRAQAPGLDDTDDGTGQAGLRAKINLVGNDSGEGAVALLPFVFIPTRGNAILDAATWGIVTPVSLAVSERAALSSMLGATRVNNDEWWFTASASLGTEIAGSLAGFLETYAASAGFSDGALNDVTVDAGLTFAPWDNWQLDSGAYLGVTDSTERWRVFVGASARFPVR
jgi:hypothetical protein